MCHLALFFLGFASLFWFYPLTFPFIPDPSLISNFYLFIWAFVLTVLVIISKLWTSSPKTSFDICI
jgi:hypothetical protein